MRLLRKPLFRFAAIGGLIFALYAAVDDTSEALWAMSGFGWFRDQDWKG
jgi:hypothetical protein